MWPCGPMARNRVLFDVEGVGVGVWVEGRAKERGRGAGQVGESEEV